MYFLSKLVKLEIMGGDVSRCAVHFVIPGFCHQSTGECENGCIEDRRGPQCLEGMDNCVLYYSQWL